MNRITAAWQWASKLILFGLLGACILANLDARAGERFQVLTRSYNNQRTAANLSETKLKPSNVNSTHFGKLFMLPVDTYRLPLESNAGPAPDIQIPAMFPFGEALNTPNWASVDASYDIIQP